MAWRWAWVSIAAVVAVLAAGCASGVAGDAVTTTSTSVTAAVDWNPQHRQTVAADIHQSTATIHVGERLQFTARDSDTVYFGVEPADLHSITFYGNDLTFVGIEPGRTTLSIFNYDKHFDCPNGPCAHPNPTLSITVTVLAGPATAPAIPAPLEVSALGRDRTVHLEVGQQLQIASALQMSTYSSSAAGITLDVELGNVRESSASATILVGAAPGTQVIGLSGGGSSTGARLTIVIGA